MVVADISVDLVNDDLVNGSKSTSVGGVNGAHKSVSGSHRQWDPHVCWIKGQRKRKIKGKAISAK